MLTTSGDARDSATADAGPNAHAAVAALLAEGERGIQVAAFLAGEPVWEIAAGRMSQTGPDVNPETVFFAASAGKVSTATALHRQVARGLVEYDTPIASVWPDFAAEGKRALTVRDALTHRLGLADVPVQDLHGDWEAIVDRLARARPSSDPLAHDAYHAFTWGFVVGEIIRRVDPVPRSFVDIVRTEVHEPLGITELWHALPPTEHGRTAVVAGDILRGDPYDFVVTEDHAFNTPAHREQVDPSGAFMTARAGARLWSAYTRQGSAEANAFLPPEVIRSFLAPRAGAHPSGVLVGGRGVIGQGGLMVGGTVPRHREVLGFGENVLWHPGAGGTLGFADVDAGLAVMICHNRLFDERPLPQHPFAPLIRAIYTDVLG